MNVLDIVYYSGLNKFFYTSDELVKSILEMDEYCVIQLNLTIKEVSYIKNNYELYISILENILFTYNQSGNKYFKNITFNKVKRGNEIFNNCIFLYSSEKKGDGFKKTNGNIVLSYKEPEVIGKTIYDKIFDLIYKKDLSVRNLIKLGIIQIRAREIYKFLKEKEVFIISENNHNYKTYDIEKYKKIGKNGINEIILGSV